MYSKPRIKMLSLLIASTSTTTAFGLNSTSHTNLDDHINKNDSKKADVTNIAFKKDSVVVEKLDNIITNHITNVNSNPPIMNNNISTNQVDNKHTVDTQSKESMYKVKSKTGRISENDVTSILSNYTSGEQLICAKNIIKKESGFNIHSYNKESGAYGLFQALPGRKMSSISYDWQDNAYTQVKWGMNYIQHRYGTPCGAWKHEVEKNWY